MDLRFTIYVDLDLPEEALIALLLKGLSGATRRGGYVRASGNVVSFERNFDHDSARARTAIEPWQYFRYHCDVFPLDDATLEGQRSFARELVSILELAGARTELCPDFPL